MAARSLAVCEAELGQLSERACYSGVVESDPVEREARSRAVCDSDEG